MTSDEASVALETIATEVRSCTACRLHTGRKHAVPGEGSPETEVVFIGEGPGASEDEQGRPFVGAAGGLLTELIGAVGWRRQDVFITNVVKCRPPGNRDPEPDEIAACSGFLHRQLEVIDPALVVTLGRFSLQSFMPGARISAAHGTVRQVDPSTGARDASVMALYHPAAAFRQAALKATLVEDIAGAPEALIASRERRAGEVPAEAMPPAPAPAPGPTTEAVTATASSEQAPPITEPPPEAEHPPAIPEPALVVPDDPDQMRFF